MWFARAARMPPGLADRVRRLAAAGGQTTEEFLADCLRCFARKPDGVRALIVSEFWAQGFGYVGWEYVPEGREARQLARAARAGGWSAAQTLVAAADWYAVRAA